MGRAMLMLVLSTTSAQAATWTVCQTGTCDFTDVPTAIDEAGNGDTLQVGDGEWSFSVNLRQDVIIESMNPGGAILVPLNPAPAFSCLWGTDVTLRGFTMDRGTQPRLLDYYVEGQGGEVLIEDFVFTDVDPENVIILVEGGTGLTVRNSTFTGDTVRLTSGGRGTVVHAIDVDVELENVEVRGVSAEYSGGAVYVDGGDLTVTHSRFEDCSVSVRRGGAIASVGTGQTLSIVDSTFEDNHALLGGGAVHFEDGNDLTVQTSLFLGNVVDDADTEGGGALLIDDGIGSSLVSENRFEHNVVVSDVGTYGVGGAVYASNRSVGSQVFSANDFYENDAEYGGAIEAAYGGGITFANNDFCDNHSDNLGGAIKLESNDNVVFITNNYLVENDSSGSGGAIQSNNSQTELHANTLLGNVSPGGSGIDGLGTSPQGSIDVRNNLFAFHSVGPAVYWRAGVGSTVAYNAWWNNVGGDVDAVGLSPLLGPYAITIDPLLTSYTPGMDCGTYDLTPQAGSSLIDGGDPSLPDSPDGTVSDVGAGGTVGAPGTVGATGDVGAPRTHGTTGTTGTPGTTGTGGTITTVTTTSSPTDTPVEGETWLGGRRGCNAVPAAPTGLWLFVALFGVRRRLR